MLRAFAVIFPEDLRLTFYEQVSPRSLRLASNSSHCSNRRFGELDSVGQTSLYLVNQAFIYLTPSRKTSSSRDTAIFALHNRVFQIVYMHDGGRPDTPCIYMCAHALLLLLEVVSRVIYWHVQGPSAHRGYHAKNTIAGRTMPF